MAKKKSEQPAEPTEAAATVPIVAIGASAGGSEAMRELLTQLSPATGMAFVYVQHLEDEQPGALADSLATATQMPVLEASDQTPVAPNHLYIIPANEELELIDGRFVRASPRPMSVIHMPIDRFFLSLTEQLREGTIAVLLSGTASDGTLGLRAVNAAGGITIAQDDSAQYQSMPRTAILEGVVDKILSPAAIALELERLSHQTAVFRQTVVRVEQDGDQVDEPADIGTDDDLRMILQLLRRAIGVDFSHYKITTIRRRIIRRTLLFKLESLADYADYLRQHPEELGQLYDDLLINVTSFFRDADTMDYVQKVLLPQIIREKPVQEPIRIWVPACSTGQEAYSLAMLLLEALGERGGGRAIQLFATDLSESAVAKARLGSYTRGEVMDVSPRRLQRFFTKIDDHYRINKSVRDLCVFAPHNLLKDPPFSRLDLISCRNLLIYLDNVLQRKAIMTFHYALNPSGYLILGKSEAVGTSAPLFSQLEKNYKVFARKNDGTNLATFAIPSADGDYTVSRPSLIPRRPTVPGETAVERLSAATVVLELDKAVDSLLLNQYVPACVVVNQDMEILQFRGSTGLFLEPAPGKASLNLIKMARPSLTFELRNVVHKAQKSGEPVRKSGLEIKLRSKVYYAAIEAVPLDTATEERLFLVVFEEVEPPIQPNSRTADARNRRIRELEAELTALREDMRSIIEEQEASNEELQSANEEIISSNEELQSINEELETSKEEIESANEELLTINQELQVRNDQLSEAHQFSEDIFGIIREATLVLDTELRVKSANPPFYQLFNLLPEITERRLIYELDNRQWDIPQLRLMLTDIVTSDSQFQGFEMTYRTLSGSEKRLSLNARRVVRQKDAILLAIYDITEHQRVQRLLSEREAWFRQIADNAPTLIWVTDAQGNYTFLNKVWAQFTGRSLDDVTTAGWSTGLYADDQPAYLTTYQASVEQHKPFETEYRLRRHDGQYRWMLEHAQPMHDAEGAFNGYIGSSVDIHIQKEMNQELDRRVRERTRELTATNSLMSMTLSASKAGLGRWDWRTNATEWDERGRQIIGFRSLEEMRSVNGWMNRIHPDDRPNVIQATEVAMNSGTPFLLEYRVIHDDGSIHYLLGTGQVERDTDGSAKNSVGLVMDISDLKQTERMLKDTALNLQAVLDSSDTAIAFVKPIRDGQTIVNFQLIICNREFAQLTDRTVEQLMGNLISVASQMLWQEQTIPNLLEVIEKNRTFYEERFDEKVNRWMLVTLKHYDDGVVIIGQDITALKEAEQRQNKLLSELEQSEENIGVLTLLRQQLRERGEFLRGISHDLRGNFSIIQGAASLLTIADSDEEREQMLSMLQRNLKQATRMLTELLDMARLEAGQEQRQLGEFDVAALLTELVNGAQGMATEKGLQLRYHGPDQLMVVSDSTKINRIAQNLLLNAVKYTQWGNVDLSWQPGPGDAHWQLIVADTGPGLSAKAGGPGGEGIGLSITRQLCSLLNGILDIDSRHNVGTRFTLTFPRMYSDELPGAE